MFDAATASLIRGAPVLEGLNLDRLPEELTAAYSLLVSLRMAQRQDAEALSSERVLFLRRLANTYEALTVLGPPNENTAAAFVAATAHRLLHLASDAGVMPGRAGAMLNADAISPDVSAMLLFLIAGYPSDAAEMARHVRRHAARGSAARLLDALSALGDGRLRGMVEGPLGEPTFDLGASFSDLAADSLWHQLLFGVRGLIARLLGLTTSSAEAAPEPQAVFREVQSAAIRTLRVPELTSVLPSILTTLPGPHHLASLLVRAGDVVLRAGVVNVDSPAVVDQDAWSDELRRFAQRRPYLWHNHLEAINGGLLNVDTSAVVSFPTGAGKSTLAELKAATILLCGGKVIFLAPTHALVGQVTHQFRTAFPDRNVQNSLVADSYYAELESPELPDVAVMTPERCLTLLSLYPETFESVGLLIFDECHLLHSDDLTSRRGIDAMLALLGIIERAPSVSLLLMSAMVSNGAQIAGWLEKSLGRPCIDVSLDWKPTRQVRACVVYDKQDVERLNRTLTDGRRHKTTKNPPATVRQRLQATPHGLFCLKSTWHTRDTEDYSLLPLTVDAVNLTANAEWRLTANKNEVAARLAAELASAGVRVLVFTQAVPNTGSIAKRVAEYVGPKKLTLLQRERELLTAAAEECGGQEFVIGPIEGVCATHHSLLLPFERELNESLFSRDGGIPALVATPTLAQGMNLPAEAVIIAGDDRFDLSSSRPTQVEAHELLNAAGRAGRAGHAAQGIVFVVPGVVVDFDTKNHQIGRRWFSLQEAIFSKADNCLAVEDPIEAVLDRIQEATAQGTPSPVTYFVNRLPIDDDGSRTRSLLNRSFGAYLASRARTSGAYAAKINTAVRATLSRNSDKDEPLWQRRVASATGVAVHVIDAIDEAIETGELMAARRSVALVKEFFKWVGGRLDVADYLLGNAVREVLGANSEIDTEAVKQVSELTARWMSGGTLADLETQLTKKAARSHCVGARRFVRRSIPEISYAVGLVVQVSRERQLPPDAAQISLDIATLAACVREGVDSPELLAAHFVVQPPASRPRVREKYGAIVTRLSPRDPGEAFAETRRRVASALR